MGALRCKSTPVSIREEGGDDREPREEMRVRERRGPWWRAQSTILRKWIRKAKAPAGWALKTDLFDEACGPHHHAADLGSEYHFLGIDIDHSVVRAAKRQLEAEGREAILLVADVRALPFAAGTICLVLSLSTLDHFQHEGELLRSLGELRRALHPDGRMVLTLDNPLNPEVALRAGLPGWLVAGLRADSFPLGATPRRGAADRMFVSVG